MPSASMRAFIWGQRYPLIFFQMICRSLRLFPCSINILEKQPTVGAKHTLPPGSLHTEMPVSAFGALDGGQFPIRFGKSMQGQVSTCPCMDYIFGGNLRSNAAMVFLQKLAISAPTGGAFHVAISEMKRFNLN